MSETEQSSPRRLYRSKKDKVIAGVCGGLGGYLNVDPVIVRIIWLALILFGGTGLLAYLIAWTLIPDPPEGKDPGPVERKTDSTRIIGIVLIVAALIWLAGAFGWLHMGGFPWAWLAPLGLVALGVALILRPRVHDASKKQDEKEAVFTSTVDSEGLEPPVPTIVTEKAPTAEIADPEISDVKIEEDANKDTEDETAEKGDAKDDDEDAKRPFDRWSLRRSTSDRVIGGVCGGLAAYLKTDSTLIRLGWALLTLASLGLGVFAYIVLYFAVSEGEG